MNKIERGAVVLVPFPNSNLQTAKLRPALIIRRRFENGFGANRLVMISSKLNRANHESRILIEAKTEQGKQSGLLFDSVVMTDNVATVLLTSISRIIGKLEEMGEIDNALRHTLNL